MQMAAMHDFPRPSHLPCPDCGASVPRDGDEAHACARERRLDYLVFLRRDEIESFETGLAAWLHTPAGRFATWLAARNRNGY
jgi:hypothetical protein